ncbi:hypothetical protein Acr_01g0013850 [Actinidia rufa]|uniref:Uncharacterized protein n=1 Tax=Actinidia rufa TaxID=165716 RepID=A0A7J0E5Y4_9ERIC|nr:hypothetical protein Acr_01g0013850 [Actinidia rufa]
MEGTSIAASDGGGESLGQPQRERGMVIKLEEGEARDINCLKCIFIQWWRLQELLGGEGSLGEELLTSWRSSWLLRGEPVLEGELLDPWRRSSVGSPWLLGGSYYVEDSSIIMESKSSKLVIVGGSLRRVAICEML